MNKYSIKGRSDVVNQLTLTRSGDLKRRSNSLQLSRSDVDDHDGKIPNGAVVDLLTSSGEYRGRGFYSAHSSSVAVRIISESKVTINAGFFESRIVRASELRKTMSTRNRSCRLVNSDGDYLPGLVVDRYGGYLVVQFRHPTIESKKNTVLDVLEDVMQPHGIYARNDLKARKHHNLDPYKGLLRGDSIPDRVRVRTEPYEVIADLKRGQKTGYYLDQQANRRALGRYVNSGRGLDCFSYSGGWGLRALYAGAQHVTFVDRSENALDLLRENLRRNGWFDKARLHKNDAFDVLNQMAHRDREFNFVALDPPAFASSDSQLEQATRGYTELNLRAMRMLKNGGILATSSCSTPVRPEDFTQIVKESARDAHTACRVLEKRTQSPDHPWLLEVQSSLYLTCLICEINLL